MRPSMLLKAWMALRGLFLALFVLVHMAGNLQLFLPEDIARPSFNAYSQALTSSIVIKVAGWVTYAAVVVHAVVSAVLTRRHRSLNTRGRRMRRCVAQHSFASRALLRGRPETAASVSRARHRGENGA